MKARSAGLGPILALFLVLSGNAAPAQEHQHQHEHADPTAAPPVPDETVVIAPDGMHPVERDVLVSTIHAEGIDRPLQVVTFESTAVGRTMKLMVLLPEGYETSGKAYPVLYLLHGFSQNYTVWPRLGVPHYTRDLDLIVVMPDGGNSWYINWAKTENDQLNNWEDYLIYDVIPIIDGTYRTIPLRQARAINGLSMGGYGAITVGLRNPGVFCSIGSHSGTLSYARNARKRFEAGEPPQRVAPPENYEPRPEEMNLPPIIEIKGFTTQAERYPTGYPFLTAEESKLHDPFELVVQLPRRALPHIYIDCGTEDNLWADSQEFAALLMANAIPFTYAQSPGAHNPTYWAREVGQSIAVQYYIIQQSLRTLELRPQDQPPPVPDTPTGEPAAAPDAEKTPADTPSRP